MVENYLHRQKIVGIILINFFLLHWISLLSMSWYEGCLKNEGMHTREHMKLFLISLIHLIFYYPWLQWNFKRRCSFSKSSVLIWCPIVFFHFDASRHVISNMLWGKSKFNIFIMVKLSVSFHAISANKFFLSNSKIFLQSISTIKNLTFALLIYKPRSVIKERYGISGLLMDIYVVTSIEREDYWCVIVYCDKL